MANSNSDYQKKKCFPNSGAAPLENLAIKVCTLDQSCNQILVKTDTS